ncbi:hypothetical protein AB0M83_30045 [Amycolatopsis sp. NPDC051106]|uniref:hypothetical protein n=1 Tax=Amycolatopsis sp. NPDC051106 TaxID=3157100 RepID=UPI003430264D
MRAAPAPSTLVRAHHPGAASLADALFRAEREPHCLHWFRPVRKAGVTTGPSLGLLWQPVRQGDRTLAGEWRFGGTAPSTLVRAGHVRAHHPGAASLADALFRAEREPHCLHWF